MTATTDLPTPTSGLDRDTVRGFTAVVASQAAAIRAAAARVTTETRLRQILHDPSSTLTTPTSPEDRLTVHLDAVTGHPATVEVSRAAWHALLAHLTINFAASSTAGAMVPAPRKEG